MEWYPILAPKCIRRQGQTQKGGGLDKKHKGEREGIWEGGKLARW